ncbi:MAG TPA: hypothetical protein VE153_37520 [Myxococcus sp.]|nr:hypothetical protein [Myxococcus sp.]
MRRPKLFAIASALLCFAPVACTGPEEPSPESGPGQSRSALEGDDNGTRISASLVGVAQCDGGNAPGVNFTGTVTTTGSVDSVELTASIDGAEAQVVGNIAPQDFVHRGRFKDAAYTVQVSVPTGEHQVTLCFVQSGAEGREEKRACAPSVAVDVECASTDGGSGGPGDELPPVTVLAASPLANAAGWNNTDVTVTLTATDDPGGSGVKEIHWALMGAHTAQGITPGAMAQLPLQAEGVTTITYLAVDNAGNIEAPHLATLNIDKTPPVISFGAQSPAANAAGWNNTDVSVPYSVVDALSGVASSSPGSPVLFTGEGTGLTATVTAVDVADNVSSAVTPAVNIDRTPPVISGIPNQCTLWPPNHKLVQVAELSSQDGLSGVNGGTWNIQGVSNEPDNGLGDGNTVEDIRITGTRVELRPERSGRGTGRIYTVTAQVSDSAGNVAQGGFICTVPHDQRKR